MSLSERAKTTPPPYLVFTLPAISPLPQAREQARMGASKASKRASNRSNPAAASAMACPSSSPPLDFLDSPSLTHYEKQRLENVKRNQAMLAALGVQNTASDLRLRNKLKRTEMKKGYKPSVEKRQKLEESVVIRRSLRSQGLSPDGEELQTVLSSVSPVAEKRIIVKSPRPKSSCKKGYNSSAFTNSTPVSPPKKPVALDSVYFPARKGVSPTRFLESLRSLADETSLSDLRGRMQPLKDGSEVLPSNLTLKSEDVARVVPDRILSVGFLPMRDRLVAFAGGRSGHLGLWDVDCKDDSEADGVHIYRPHRSPLAGISVAPFSASKIVTCSYDGTIRQLDIESSKFEVLYSTDDLLSAISFVPGNVHCIFHAEGEGRLKLLDTREGKSHKSGFELHERRINTIDFNLHSTSVMVTGSSDSTACVWDIRKLKNASSCIMKVEHRRAVHSAFFSPSGSTLATCSYDNTIGLLRGFRRERNGVSGFTQQEPTMIVHYNRTNRWISTFRAIWGWDDEHVYVGNMKRAIDVVSSSLNATSCSLSSPFMTAIPSRLAVHPLLPGILAGSTAGGQLYIWRQ